MTVTNSTEQEIQAIKNTLSHPRIATYERAVTSQSSQSDRKLPLQLYMWNAQLSGAFLVPLHICEVIIRNAIAQTIKRKYGPHWPCSPAFLKSLPSPRNTYNPLHDLKNTTSTVQVADMVVPKLSFVFWQHMFTKRHHSRLWELYLKDTMPYLDKSKTPNIHRQNIYKNLGLVRTLRNRIAHHEPIFTRDLNADMERILGLISCRCQTTSNWVLQHQKVYQTLKNRPTY